MSNFSYNTVIDVVKLPCDGATLVASITWTAVDSISKGLGLMRPLTVCCIILIKRCKIPSSSDRDESQDKKKIGRA